MACREENVVNKDSGFAFYHSDVLGENRGQDYDILG